MNLISPESLLSLHKIEHAASLRANSLRTNTRRANALRAERTPAARRFVFAFWPAPAPAPEACTAC